MQDLVVKQLGVTDYAATLAAMQTFTSNRTHETPDEIWLTAHAPIYTLGLNRKNVRLPDAKINSNNIPVVLVDRGGKMTYHGPGQVVIYLLFDLKRRNSNVRAFVDALEASIIALLGAYHLKAYAIKDAPGVYIDDNGKPKKIASLGLRLKNNCCYHGLSLNVDMDLTPFYAIDPCGYVGLEVTQTKDLGIAQTPQQLGEALLKRLQEKLTE
jgi:lipoyl(octanoyl) transferase